MRLMTLSLLAGALALTMAATVQAQEEDPPPEAPPPRSEAPFIDTDGDGINDMAAAMHRHQMIHRGQSAFHRAKRQQFNTMFEQLSDEQKAEIKALAEQLREEGTDPAQIHAAVGAKFEEFGLTLPDMWDMTPREFVQANRLTREESEAIRAMVGEMRQAGATRQEIRDAVAAKHQEFGKEMLGREMVGPPQPRMPGAFGDERLTDEQRTELRTLLETMRGDGATPQQIRDAVSAKFSEWGVELPERPQQPPRRRGNR